MPSEKRVALGRLGRSTRYKPRLKASRTYTVREVAELCGMKKLETIRRWIAQGLPVIDHRRPTLVRGADVLAFLAKRAVDRKRPCPPGTIFCFACKKPRVPAFGLVEFHHGVGPHGRLRGFCPVCSTGLYRSCARDQVPEVMPGIDVQFVTASPRLMGFSDAIEKRISERGGSDGEI